MRSFWVFLGGRGAGSRLGNCKMWGVITNRRYTKVPWWWDWLKSWQQNKCPRRGREVTFLTSWSQLVWWEVTGEPTLNGWDFFCLRGQGKSAQSFCNILSHSTWAITEVNLGPVCTPAKSLRRRHYLEMLPSTTLVLARSSDFWKAEND